MMLWLFVCIMFYLCDFAEFAKNITVRLGKNAAYNVLSKDVVKLPDKKKVFAFTNKQFGTSKKKNLPPGLNRFDWGALKENTIHSYESPGKAKNMWLLHKEKNVPIKEVINESTSVDIPLTRYLKQNRMGVAKVNVALRKLQTNDSPKVVNRYITIPKEEFESFKKLHDGRMTGKSMYTTNKKGKINYTMPLSTGVDDSLLNSFKKHHRDDAVKIKYHIKPKKNSSGKYLGHYKGIDDEGEFLYPSRTAFKKRGLKKSWREDSIGTPQYDLFLDEL